LGETGMGKSTLLVELALRAAALGTVFLFDPVGDIGRRFLRSINSEDEERITWISPADCPVGWNALGAVSGAPGTLLSERALGDLVLGLKRVRSSRFEDSSYWGPRIEEVVLLALRAAALWPAGTLLTAQRLLENAAGPLGSVPPEAAGPVAELRARVRERPDEVDGSRRLLGEIGRLNVLRRLLASPAAPWSLNRAVQPGQITVITGDAPVVGEYAARYLLAVYLALLWPTILARAGPAKTFVLLDEIQWYGHEGIGEMLRLGRRFNLHVYGATQSLKPLPAEVQDAWLTNAADVIVFRGSPEEAELFGRWTPWVVPQRILALRRGEALLFQGKGAEVRTLRVRVPEESVDSSGRFERLAQRLRPLWSLEEEPLSAPSTPAPEFPRSSGDLLEVLRVLAIEAEEAGRLRVELDALRGTFPSIEPTLRESGQVLGRWGVLEESSRDAGGRYWLLRVRGWPDPTISPASKAAELAQTAHRWRAEGLVHVSRQRF
ncbi:MAG TPA: hypothetical protein VJS68_03060, partial [Thermoplasmata archaeon]|nr:hypothetical protein [Thermoplasmata archaeon]